MDVNQSKTPWESEDCLPVKPADAPYGYMEGREFTGCTMEELKERCASLRSPQIELVWHPQAPRVVPVWTVDFLLDSIKGREKANLRHNIKVSSIITLVSGIITLLAILGLEKKNGTFILVILFGTVFGVLPLYFNWKDLRNFDKLKWGVHKEFAVHDRYDAWIQLRRSVMTSTLAGIIIFVGAMQVLAAWQHPLPAPYSISILRTGLEKEAVRGGEWWRLLTAPLLHGGLMHFIFNLSALIGLGRLFEALCGAHRLVTVFLVSALGGNLLSLYLMPHTASIGASGGLLGFMGFLIVLGVRRKKMLPPEFLKVFWINVGLVVVMGVAAWASIDNAAHLGGFITGAALGTLFVAPTGTLPLPNTRSARVCGMLSMVVLLLSAFFAIGRMFGKI
jgi:membrane associated rhomboid family serine protease